MEVEIINRAIAIVKKLAVFELLIDKDKNPIENKNKRKEANFSFLRELLNIKSFFNLLIYFFQYNSVLMIPNNIIFFVLYLFKN